MGFLNVREKQIFILKTPIFYENADLVLIIKKGQIFISKNTKQSLQKIQIRFLL